MKWKKWRGGEPSKQKKNCGRHDSTHSHRRNTTFSRVFLRFFSFLALVELARALRSAFNILYLCVDNTEHTYTHTFQSWSIKLSYTMRLGWFARNLCNKCEQKNGARGSFNFCAAYNANKHNNNFSDINILCVRPSCRHTSGDAHKSIWGSYNDAHETLQQHSFHLQSKDTIFVGKQRMHAKLIKKLRQSKNVEQIENLFHTKFPAGSGKLEFIASLAISVQF